MAASATNVAVILAGAGVYDGSEITEAVSILIALGDNSYQCFAPDCDQMHAVDHTKGEPHDNNRNCLQEAARIARGNVKPLSELNAADYDAMIVPGGFGVAKNLCTWAVKNTDCTVNEQMSRVMAEFREANKPMGFACIAPVLVAKIFGGDNPEITFGCASETSDEGSWPYSGTAAACEQLGARHVETKQADAHIDANLKIVTASLYMFEGKPHQIFASATSLVQGLLSLL